MKFFDNLRERYPANLGTLDRLLRSVIAVALLVLVFARVWSGWLIAMIAILAIYLILTGDVGFSPIYKLFGWSTARHKPVEKNIEG